MATQRFFDRDRTVERNRSLEAGSQSIKASLHLVCKHQDACFKSLAVAIVDNVSKALINDLMVKHLLEDYKSHFSTSVNYGSLKNRADFEKLIRTMTPHETAQFVANLAFILRQRAIDKIICKPTEYREAFSKRANLQTVGEMRDPEYHLDVETAIAAVSDAYNLPITLRISTREKVIWARKSYKCSPGGPSMLLQLHDDTIFLHLKEEAVNRFNVIDRINVSAQKVRLHQQPDPEIETIRREIDTTDQQFLNKLNEEKERINSMLKAEELTQEHLQAVFHKITNSGTVIQSYLGVAKNAHYGPSSLNEPSRDSDKQILIEAIAALISSKQIDPDILYKQTEARETQQISGLR